MNTRAQPIAAVENNELPNQETSTVYTPTDGWYARYVLSVLLLIYVLNFVDRQILAILAEDIKADLGISDAQLGFLFGTAFAVFYATFGIALGRLADIWDRRKLIAIGLSFWSLMTAFSGAARGFLPLAVCRFGVGMGEASASPAAYSILYDYFSPKVRTTVLAIYSGGVYIGAGVGLFIGGTILEVWNSAWPDATHAPFGLKGWQAAFMIVGVPGLLVALWASTLREPIRGQMDGIVHHPHPHPFREVFIILISMLPVANLWVLSRKGQGYKAIAINIATALVIALSMWSFIVFSGDILQWMALGIGIYAVFSWGQVLAARDPVVFGLIFRTKTLRSIMFAGGSVTFMGFAFSFWTVPFLQRYHGVSAGEAGTVLGLATATMGFFGVVLGGMLADKLRTYTRKGKLYVWLLGTIVSWLSALFFLLTSDLTLAYASFFIMNLTSPMALGPAVSTVNDLMLPRGRGTASAFMAMVATFIGIALGPYITGHISDALVVTGIASGEALRQAMMWSLLLPIAGIVLVIFAVPHVGTEEASLLERARALGESV